MKKYNIVFIYNGRYVKEYGLDIFKLIKTIIWLNVKHIDYDSEEDK